MLYDQVCIKLHEICKYLKYKNVQLDSVVINENNDTYPIVTSDGRLFCYSTLNKELCKFREREPIFEYQIRMGYLNDLNDILSNLKKQKIDIDKLIRAREAEENEIRDKLVDYIKEGFKKKYSLKQVLEKYTNEISKTLGNIELGNETFCKLEKQYLTQQKIYRSQMSLTEKLYNKNNKSFMRLVGAISRYIRKILLGENYLINIQETAVKKLKEDSDNKNFITKIRKESEGIKHMKI